ncbi:MAG: protein kinase [Planctomycetota bacterium]
MDLPPELSASGVVAGRLAPGARMGPYLIEGILGAGGMGAVYAARHLELQREVALKTLLDIDADPEEQQRFVSESRALARIDHPNVVKVHDAGAAGPVRYLVMERVRGESLAQRLEATGALPPQEAVRIVLGVTHGVAAAHAQGILHRDLKPANVLVGEDGVPRLTDFGLARGEADRRLTASGIVVGTPHYMAPEQALGEREQLGPPSDIYGVGAILYECVTGRPPYHDSPSILAVLQATIEGRLVAPRALVPELPRDLEAVILRCLAREPELRYPEATALAADLQRFLRGEPVEARLEGPLTRLVRRARGQLKTAALSALATALLLGLIVLAALPLARARSLGALEARAEAWRAARLAELGREPPAEESALRERLAALEPAALRAAARAALGVALDDAPRARALDRGLGPDEELVRASGPVAAALWLRLAAARRDEGARRAAWAQAWVEDPTGPDGRTAALELARALRARGDVVARPLADELLADLVGHDDAPGRAARVEAARAAAERLELGDAAALLAAAGEGSGPLLTLARGLSQSAPLAAELSLRPARGEPGVLALEERRVSLGDLAGAPRSTWTLPTPKPRLLELGPVRAPDRPELLVVRDEGQRCVWESYEQGPLAEAHRLWAGTPPRALRFACTGDLDGDGLRDLVLVGWEGAAESCVLLAAGPSTPLRIRETPCPPYVYGQPLCADLDGDGRDELLLPPSELQAEQRLEVWALAGGRLRELARLRVPPPVTLAAVRVGKRDAVLLLTDEAPSARPWRSLREEPEWLGLDGCYVIAQEEGAQAPRISARWTWGEGRPSSAARYAAQQAAAWPWRFGEELLLVRGRRTAAGDYELEAAPWQALGLERAPEPSLRLRCPSPPPGAPQPLGDAPERGLRWGPRRWSTAPADTKGASAKGGAAPADTKGAPAAPATAKGEAEAMGARASQGQALALPDRLARAARWLLALGREDEGDEAADALLRRLRREHPTAGATRALARAAVDALLARADDARAAALRAYDGLQAEAGEAALRAAEAGYARAAARAEALATGREGTEPERGPSWAQAAYAWAACGQAPRALAALEAALVCADLRPDERARLERERIALRPRAAWRRVEVRPQELGDELRVLRPEGVRRRSDGLLLRCAPRTRDGLLVPVRMQPGPWAFEADLELQGPCWCSVLRLGLFDPSGKLTGVAGSQWDVGSCRLILRSMVADRGATTHEWPSYDGPLRLRVELEPTASGGTRLSWTLRAGVGGAAAGDAGGQAFVGSRAFVGETELAEGLIPRLGGGERARLYLGIESHQESRDLASFDQGGWPGGSRVRVVRLALEAAEAELGWRLGLGKREDARERLRRGHARLVRGDASGALEDYGAVLDDPALDGAGAPAELLLEARWWRGFARARRGDRDGVQDLEAVTREAPWRALEWFEDLADALEPGDPELEPARAALARLARDPDPLVAALARSLGGEPLAPEPPAIEAWARGDERRRGVAWSLRARYPTRDQPGARAEVARLGLRLPRTHLTPTIPFAQGPDTFPGSKAPIAAYHRARAAWLAGPDAARTRIVLAYALNQLGLSGDAAIAARRALPLAQDPKERNATRILVLASSVTSSDRALTLDLLRAYRGDGGSPGSLPRNLAALWAGDAEIEALLK